MSSIATIGLVISAGSAVNTADNQRKSLHAQQDALKANNTASIEAQTAQQSKDNATQSAELERQLTPEVPQLRTAANNALLGQIGNSSAASTNAENLLNGGGLSVDSPLLKAAIMKAQQNLALGGQLDTDTQNAVTRRGLATAATVGGGGLGLGRDVVARDLGLTSLDLQQQRLNDASRIGGQEVDMNNSSAANLLNHVSLLNSLNNARNANNLGIAQYAESIQRPIVGLDPGSAASLQISNNNAAGALAANQAEIKAKQNAGYANLAGQALGAWQAYSNRPTTTPAYTAPAYNPAPAASGSPYPYISNPNYP